MWTSVVLVWDLLLTLYPWALISTYKYKCVACLRCSVLTNQAGDVTPETGPWHPFRRTAQLLPAPMHTYPWHTIRSLKEKSYLLTRRQRVASCRISDSHTARTYPRVAYYLIVGRYEQGTRVISPPTRRSHEPMPDPEISICSRDFCKSSLSPELQDTQFQPHHPADETAHF